MKSDIVFDVIGNTGPFSLSGESSGYMVTVNGHRYLLECGATVFPALGLHGIEQIKGIFATHSHEDHRRWFTDIVLYMFYDCPSHRKVRLISSETILEEYHKNSKGALERSLSEDSKRIVDIPYHSMVEGIVIGPRSRYFIFLESKEDGSFQYLVKDRLGQVIGPDRAKIFINPQANRPRLLYKDEESGEWVEPESYYPFSSSIFYEADQNVFTDDEAGLAVKAVKSSAWHGVPTIAFRFMTSKNSLFFSADTVYNPSLWKELCESYRPQNFELISRKDFEKKSVIFGDINHFIERTWSRGRYEAAVSAYTGSVIIHDVARKKSVVHTDYPFLDNVEVKHLLFTHSPDNLVALRPILKSGMRVVLRNGELYEWVKGSLYPYDADIYVKHFTCNLVGYRSRKGRHKVIRKDGLLGIVGEDSPEPQLMRVNIFQDIDGEYFPILTDPKDTYQVRPNGKVERVTIETNSSSGEVVRNIRRKMKKNAK